MASATFCDSSSPVALATKGVCNMMQMLISKLRAMLLEFRAKPHLPNLAAGGWLASMHVEKQKQ